MTTREKSGSRTNKNPITNIWARLYPPQEQTGCANRDQTLNANRKKNNRANNTGRSRGWEVAVGRGERIKVRKKA